MSKTALRISLVIISTLFSFSATPSQAIPLSEVNNAARYQSTGTTYFLDAQNGSDNNSCAVPAQAWQSIPAAMKCLNPGDTLIFNAGIYTLDQSQTYDFGPSGTDVAHKTTYQAASGARVIITGNNRKPVNIHLLGYMHVEGLWFGGSWDTVDGIDAFGHGESVNPIFVLGGPLNDVINCTFFGYAQTGNGRDYLLFQGNRSVRTGGGDLSHGIYLSGHDGTTTQEDNHAIVDNNIFIGQEIPNPHYGQVAGAPKTYLMGLGIQAWHLHNNNIITRNFVTHHIANTIQANNASDSVRSDLVANNLWWEDGVSSNTSYPDGFWISKHIDYWNNLSGPGGGIASSDIRQTTVGNTFFTNAFALGISNHLLPNAPLVVTPGPYTMSTATVAAGEGTTPAALDQTISALQSSFSVGVNGRTIQNLFQDQTIEPNFAKLNFTTPGTSPLYQTGTPWFNSASPLNAPDPTAKINIGPGISAPASAGLFWAAARALGLQDYDDSGKPMTVPYPTFPYPSTGIPVGVVLPIHGPPPPPLPPLVTGLLPGAPPDGDGSRDGFASEPPGGDGSGGGFALLVTIVNAVDPALALPGDKVVYSVTLHAVSSTDGATVQVTDLLPDQVTITGTSTALGHLKISGHTVSFVMEGLKVGQTVTFFINAQVGVNIVPPQDLFSVASVITDYESSSATAILHLTHGLLPGTGEHPA